MNEKKKVKLAIDQDYFKIKGILSSVYYSENGSLLGVSEKIQNLFNNNELVNLLDRQNEFIQVNILLCRNYIQIV